MPVQVVPHMYRMLADEIQWANDDVSLSLIHVLPCAPFLPQVTVGLPSGAPFIPFEGKDKQCFCCKLSAGMLGMRSVR